MKKMKPNQLKTALKICQLSGVTPMVWSTHGLGKSQIVQQYATENELAFIDLRLGQMEVGDLVGMPERDGDCTIWLKPSWFPQEGKGVLFLDEINRANRAVLQAIFQLVLDKKLHDHELPEGWQIVCAGNPDTEGYLITQFDDALMDRFVHLVLDKDVSSWLEWASKKNVPSQICNFVKSNTRHFAADAETIIKTTPSPRSWEMLGKMYSYIKDDSNLFFEIAQGLVGSEVAQLFKHYLTSTTMITAHDIIRDEKKIQEFAKSEDSKNHSHINIINEELHMILKSENVNITRLNNLLRYLNIIPADATKGFVQKLAKDNNTVFKKLMDSYKVEKKLYQALTEKIEGFPENE